MKLEYENGYPYSDPLPSWLDYQSELVQKKNKAALIFVDGELGQGKSTMAAQMLRQVDSGFKDNKESIQLRYMLGGKELLQGVGKAHKAGAKGIIFDEAGIDMSSRSAMTTMNRNLLSFFQIHRALKMVVFVVLPTIKIIDRQIFDYGIHRFTVHTFGMVNGKYTRFRVYDRDATLSLHMRLRNYDNLRQAYFAPSGFNNFRGVSKPLPASYQRLLDEMGLEAKKERLLGLGGAEGVTVTEACGEFGVMPPRLARILKKHAIKTWPSPEDRRIKMFSKEDYERIRTLEFDGEDAI